MSRKDTAMDLFNSGYNCSQAVALAFSDLLDVDRESLARITSSFGGGMGRLREVCGAVTGAFVVLGLLYGYSDNETGDKKAAHYDRIQAFAKEFEEEFGSIICRNLLGLGETASETQTKKRPCVEYVGKAAEILEKFIEDN